MNNDNNEKNNIPTPTPTNESVLSEINTRNKNIYSAEPSMVSSTGEVSSSIFNKPKPENIQKKDD